MKRILILVLCAIFPVLFTGCATTSFATRNQKFIRDTYRPVALLKNEGGQLLCEAAGPFPREEHVFFYATAACSNLFLEKMSADKDSAAIANFIGANSAGIFFGPRSKVKPDGFFEIIEIGQPISSIEAGGHNVSVGYRHLNAIWTVPVDIATSPIQLIFILIMMSQIQC